jgi:hypothetical protein
MAASERLGQPVVSGPGLAVSSNVLYFRPWAALSPVEVVASCLPRAPWVP